MEDYKHATANKPPPPWYNHDGRNYTRSIRTIVVAKGVTKIVNDSFRYCTGLSSVGKAVELGVVNGYGNGKFGPSDEVTYEQAVTMIVRTLDYENEAIAQNKGTPLDRGSVAIIIYKLLSFLCLIKQQWNGPAAIGGGNHTRAIHQFGWKSFLGKACPASRKLLLRKEPRN